MECLWSLIRYDTPLFLEEVRIKFYVQYTENLKHKICYLQFLLSITIASVTTHDWDNDSNFGSYFWHEWKKESLLSLKASLSHWLCILIPYWSNGICGPFGLTLYWWYTHLTFLLTTHGPMEKITEVLILVAKGATHSQVSYLQTGTILLSRHLVEAFLNS